MKQTNLTAWKAPEANTVVVKLASQSVEARKMLNGKTLLQVAEIHGLTDEDVDFVTTNGVILNLSLKIDGVEYLVPLSRSFPMDKKADPQYLLGCEFRESFISVKEADGQPKRDESGAVILDETKPYLSFGKPSGITITSRESIFNEANKPVVDEAAANS